MKKKKKKVCLINDLRTDADELCIVPQRLTPAASYSTHGDRKLGQMTEHSFHI